MSADELAEGEDYQPPVTWSFTDHTYCAHSEGEQACGICTEATDEPYMVGVLVLGARDIGDHIGAPFGASWEVPPESEQGAYALSYVPASSDPQADLTADGFDATETG